MTVFKTYLKILNKNKFIVILYTVILLVFGITNMSNTESTINFSASKPNILIVNDDDSKLANNLVKYMSENCKIVEKKDNLSIDDALFYREINYVIYIDKNYSADFLEGKNPTIEVKSSGDYNSSLAEMMLKRYVKISNIYNNYDYSEDELIEKINNTLDKNSKVEVMSKLDTTSLDKLAYYFNFSSYSILACLIYVICLITSIFNNDKIRKRTIISSMNYKKHNRLLLLSNLVYSFILWLFYVVIGYFIVGNTLLSMHGLVFIINSFIFTICATTLAFLVGNLVNKKESISGIMNVISLGSSFLCGAFVPQEMLPPIVLKVAHLLPTYYFICSNDKIKTIQNINLNTLQPVLINMLIMIIFILVFIVINNYISSKKRKIG